MGLSPSPARLVVEHALGQPPTLGSGRLVCVDGPAGAGKTTLAAGVAALVPDALVLHTDALLEGWRGLPGLGATLAAVLAPLARGEEASYREWDWHASTWGATRTVAPAPLVVLEGVGSAPARCADLVTTLVWVETPRDVRTARWWERDGEAMRPYWDDWFADETALHERERTRARADLVVDGTA